ncbi:MAG: hypothetical protein [Bacteriophage sp.]|nr:MAG: hypothetical protein [Bacteriophage sp.]
METLSYCQLMERCLAAEARGGQMSKPTYEELEAALKELRRIAFSARRNSHNCGPFQYSDLCEEIIDMTALIKEKTQ